jgi:hypothetical protein
MQFPDVPEEFLRDFIRGCWDGDGSIFIGSSGELVATFVTGSLAFITGMRDRLWKYGFGRLTIHTRQPDGVKTKNPSYSMKISTGPALEFCRFLYHDVPDGLLLVRKFLTYKNIESDLSQRPRRRIAAAKYDWRDRMRAGESMNAYLRRMAAADLLRQERMRPVPSMKAAPASLQGTEAATPDRTSEQPKQCAATGRGWVCTFYRIPGSQFCAYHQPHTAITSPGV